MKKKFLLLLISIFSLNCYSQISFEKGYYIDNTNQKIDCFIQNVDWKNNPTEFEYKLSENGETQRASIKSIREFGVDNISKYIRRTVNIDRSSENINNLSSDKNPIFKEEELFLKVLVEGEANLYFYEDNSLRRFFYNKQDGIINQLIYKSYKPSSNRIGKNNRFRNQLWNDLKCSTFKINKVENIDYKRNALINFFVAYNECHNKDYINFEEKKKQDLFNLSLRPGFNNSSLAVLTTFENEQAVDFGNESTFRFGVEAEFILPFNKNKWSFIIEPTYQSFKSEVDLGDQIVEADYKSVELPLGVRYYFFLNEDSKIFINGSFIFDISFNSVIDFESETSPDFDIDPRTNLAIGLGYKYNDRYSIELRQQNRRDLFNNFVDYRTFSVILGYSLF